MATELEYAYAAGIFDGEGTIDMKDRVRMAVKMTDAEPVLAMQDILGGHFYQWQDQKSGRPTFEWRAAGWDGVMDAIDRIFVYSRGKRRQLQVVANWYDYKGFYGPNNDAKAIASNQLRSLRQPLPEPLTFDIETMGLDMHTLPMLSCSYMRGDDETHVWADWKKKPEGERGLAVAIRDTLEGAPYTIGFNSIRFDIPWIQRRLAEYGERPMFLGSHDDVSEDYKLLTGRKKRTSLHDMANELGLTDEEVHKTPIDWAIWNAANEGDMIAMDYVVHHGDMDIILTKRGHNAIKRQSA